MIALAAPAAQAPPPANPVAELKKTVSASRLNCWHQCRLKFFFRYVLRIIKAPTVALHVGSTVHAVLKAWSKGRWRNEPFVTQEFQEKYEKLWEEEKKEAVINWDGEEAAERTATWSLLETYFIETPIKVDEKPEAVEVYVETDLSSHGLTTLIGYMDLVRAGRRIVEFKTSGKTPDPEMAPHLHETQTSAYCVMYRDNTGQREAGVELHILVKTKSPRLVVTSLPPMNDRQETRLYRSIESYLTGLDREDFVPSPGFHCAGCEYFNECRRFDARKAPHAQ